MATCSAASWSPIEPHYEALRALSRVIGPVLGPFECYLTMRGIKTFAAAHGAPVRQRLPRGELAGHSSARGARLLHRRPRASRRRHHPPRASRTNLYGAMVSFEIRDAGQRRSFPLHGQRQDDRPRHVARRRPHHDALPCHEFAPRNFAQASRTHGHSRQPGPPLGGNRSVEDIIADLAQALG